jgi:hypothetical protein
MPMLEPIWKSGAFDLERGFQHAANFLGDAHRQSCRGIGGLARLTSSTTNSSPPRRATVSSSRRKRLRRPPTWRSRRIADAVSARVVDALELVQVDEQQRTQLFAAPRCGQRLGEAVHEQSPIGQAGERIVVGQLRMSSSACL